MPTRPRTVLIYCRDPDLGVTVRGAIPSDHTLVVSTDNWRDVQRSAHAASCVVTVIPWLDGRDVERIGDLKRRHPRCAVVVATTRDVNNTAALKSVSVEDVAWLQSIGELWVKVRGAWKATFLETIAARVEQADNRLGASLARALCHALRAQDPPVKVVDLAKRVGLDRRTLNRAWKIALATNSGIRLEDFLVWIIVIHAHSRLAPGRKPVSIAADLGIHEDTLSRYAQKSAGVTLAPAYDASSCTRTEVHGSSDPAAAR